MADGQASSTERGTTVLLTTQALDEAEHLAERIAILHEGRIIVNDTLAELKLLLPPAKVEYVEKQPTLEDIFLAIVGAGGHDGEAGSADSTARTSEESTMNTHFFGDTAVLTGRSLRHITRSLDTIITTTIMPIAFLLLFVFVFGGAINTGSDSSYVNYLLPGILLITVASGVAYTAYRLFLDMQTRSLRAVSLHADRTVVCAVGACADLAGRQHDAHCEQHVSRRRPTAPNMSARMSARYE